MRFDRGENGTTLTARRRVQPKLPGSTDPISSNQRSNPGVPQVPSEVNTKKGEPIEKALRRLKKKLDREGVLRELRNRRHYEKPSEIRRREEKRIAKRITKPS